MTYKFSQKLRERLQRHLEKDCSLVVSDETADEFLSSYSALYLSFNEIERKRNLPKAKTHRSIPLLDYKHTSKDLW